jgi:pyruvate,water dikinase
MEQIASYAKQDLDEIDRMESNARDERERAIEKYRKQYAKQPEQLAHFNKIVFQGKDDVETMENHNYLMEQMTGGTLREAVWWVGERMVSDDLIDAPDDVMHLSLDELKRLSSGRGKTDVRKLISERQEEFARRSKMTPPTTIGTGKPSGPPQMPPWLEPPRNMGQTKDGKLIRGVSGSRGRATGRARVAPQTAKPPQVEKGDVLVATNAGPNWTPIFPLIGGLVLDQGAVFQHAALVAREYRIPAVIMTKEGTSVIRDGQTVTVDGDKGIVELA